MEIIINNKILENWTLIPEIHKNPITEDEIEASVKYLLEVMDKWNAAYPNKSDRDIQPNYVKLNTLILKLSRKVNKLNNATVKTVKHFEGKDVLSDEETEKWLLDNIVFMNNGFYDLHSNQSFSSKIMLNDYYGEHCLHTINDNGTDVITQPVDRVNANSAKLKAPGGMAWIPVAATDYKPIDIIDGEMCINTYKPFTIKTVEGDTSLFVSLVEFICGEYADLVLDHMAFTLQHPEKKIIWQILIYDPVKRNGKTAIFRAFERLIGRLVSTIDPEMAKSGWGDAFIKTKVVIFEEIYGFDSSMFNSIKPKLSNDNFELLNQKSKGIVRQANRYSMYMLSNHENCLQMDIDEDKLLVIKGPGRFICGDTLNQKSKYYYDEYHDWLRSEDGKNALGHFLMNRDVSDFKWQSPPPRTLALAAVCKSAAPVYETQMMEWEEDCVAPFNTIGVIANEIYEALPMGSRPKSVKGIDKVLRKMGYTPQQGKKQINNKRHSVRFWAKENNVKGLTTSLLYDIYNVECPEAGLEIQWNGLKFVKRAANLKIVKDDEDSII